ncbi:GNAT family N-acetyltransferase [Nocardioides sp. Soil796]|uniref:GNAT family N-acetyltransferase n=1 Tax=Nocardioides sp. Soil796 TaxID=1736412 RepID=UPI0007098AD8|nr:GNAT family N-acetyltransferase [Nocardioides sp. Soil796]KRF20759.1 GNAT family acetyltransferase [Nocardioides sp. Soil796]
MSVTVGPLEAGDRVQWGSLFTGYLEFYESALPQQVYDRNWEAFAADDTLHALGARIDGRLVGITHFLTHADTWGDDVCYLEDLFSASDVRGKGVARALIEAVAAWASAHGCAKLYWHTHETNATARLLYDKVAENRGFIRYQRAL